MPTRPRGVALREAGALDQPRGAELGHAVGGGELGGTTSPGSRAASAASVAASTIGFVKNEPALRDSGSSGSTTMPLPRRSSITVSRTSAERRALALRDAERARELGVAERRADSSPRASSNCDLEMIQRALALEHARAIREPALRAARTSTSSPVVAIVRAHARDRVGDLLAVRADVLHRRRADEARDARQALDAREPGVDHLRDEVVPHDAGGQR